MVVCSVDSRQNVLKQKEDTHGKTKEDLDNLVLEKNQNISELKAQSQAALEMKKKNLKELQDEIARVKDMIREARLLRKGLDE